MIKFTVAVKVDCRVFCLIHHNPICLDFSPYIFPGKYSSTSLDFDTQIVPYIKVCVLSSILHCVFYMLSRM